MLGSLCPLERLNAGVVLSDPKERGTKDERRAVIFRLATHGRFRQDDALLWVFGLKERFP